MPPIPYHSMSHSPPEKTRPGKTLGIVFGLIIPMCLVILAILGQHYGRTILGKVVLKFESRFDSFLSGDRGIQRLLRVLVDYVKKKTERHPGLLRLPSACSERTFVQTPTPPPSYDHVTWDHFQMANRDHLECNDVDRNYEHSSPSPETASSIYSDEAQFSTPPEFPASSPGPPQAETLDDLCTPAGRARVKLQQDFPHGVERIPTSGERQLCGLFAAQLSMEYQTDFKDIRRPTTEELQTIWKRFRKTSPDGNENSNFFELYQLARIVQTYLEMQGVASKLGTIAPCKGVTVFPIIVSDFSHMEGAERVLWVYNDGGRNSQDGTHWQGLRSAGLSSSTDMQKYWGELMGVPGLPVGSVEHSKVQNPRQIALTWPCRMISAY